MISALPTGGERGEARMNRRTMILAVIGVVILFVAAIIVQSLVAPEP